MKFLLDACVASRALQRALEENGQDVLSANVRHAHASDEELLQLAREEGRVLVTRDKDFGELIFLHRLPHPSVVRLADLDIPGQAQAMRYLIEHHESELRENAVIVVTEKRVRIRSVTDTGHR